MLKFVLHPGRTMSYAFGEQSMRVSKPSDPGWLPFRFSIDFLVHGRPKHHQLVDAPALMPLQRTRPGAISVGIIPPMLAPPVYTPRKISGEMELVGLEPTTSCMPCRRSSS